MKLYFGIFLIFLMMDNALAMEYIENNIYGGHKILDSDVVVMDGVIVGADNIKIAESMRIENYGVVNSDVDLCDRCELLITNYGVFDSQFTLGKDSSIVQYVTSHDNMKRIDFNVAYDVVFNSQDHMNFSDVVEFADAADSLIIKNTVLNLDSIPSNVSTVVHFGERVVINIGDLDVVGKTLVLDNVTFDTNLRFIGVDDDTMYVKRGYVQDGGLYVERVRETDYSKVLGGRLGEYLNSLRLESGAGDFMQMMDSAQDMNAINHAMNKTVRMNPVLLKNKLESLHFADLLNFDVSRYGAGLSLFGVGDSDMSILGVGAGYRFAAGNDINLDLDVRLGKMLYSSDVDEFEANIYAGRVRIEYDAYEELFVRAGLGVMLSDFDIGAVFYNGHVFENPMSISGYGNIDVGYKYNLYNSLYVAPIIGADVHFYDIENYSMSDVFMRIGGDFGYTYISNAIEYQYMLRVYMNDEVTPSIMGRVGFWSEMDGIGGHLSFGAIHTNDITSYNFTINAQMAF